MRLLDRDKRILIMFNSGLAPSEIDRRMKLMGGTARVAVVSAWAYDKENARRDKSDPDRALRTEEE